MKAVAEDEMGVETGIFLSGYWNEICSFDDDHPCREKRKGYSSGTSDEEIYTGFSVMSRKTGQYCYIKHAL